MIIIGKIKILNLGRLKFINKNCVTYLPRTWNHPLYTPDKNEWKCNFLYKNDYKIHMIDMTGYFISISIGIPTFTFLRIKNIFHSYIVSTCINMFKYIWK